MSGIVFDFKAIRERRNALGGQDIIKEYAQPEPRADWRDDPNVMHLGTVKAGTVLTATEISDMMDLWHKKMAEAFAVRREHLLRQCVPIVGRWNAPVTVEFVNPMQAALGKAAVVAAHKATNPPVFVDINWEEIGTYGRSPAVDLLSGSVNYADPNARPPIREPGFVEDDPCDECGCDPCECEDDPYEPAYEPE